MLQMTSHNQAVQSECLKVYYTGGPQFPVKMGTHGSPKYYENGDPLPAGSAYVLYCTAVGKGRLWPRVGEVLSR